MSALASGVFTQIALAVVLGAGLAAGILLAAVRIPRWAAPTLAQRIAPYVRDVADPLGLTPSASPGWAPGWSALRDRLLNGWQSGQSLALKLRQAGRESSVTAFRASQLGWALGGLAAGGLVAVGAVLAGAGGAVSVLAPPLGAALAVVLREQQLARAARRRTERIHDELPTVLEFLGLCLAAGEGLRDGLRRVGDVGSGELTAELRRVVLATGTGSNLADALTDMARTANVPALARATDHIVSAIERGAPLAQVLLAQATDAREEAKRELIETAGRKEILMLLPLVFLVLPLSVIFALLPGLFMLRLGVG